MERREFEPSEVAASTTATESTARAIAVILVHYHGPELVERAWRSLETDAAASGLELEGVVIDNGSTAEERRALDRLPPSRVDPGMNSGYAGGANEGMRQTRSEIAILLNPDVQVLPGCLGALVSALDAGAAVAGPAFFWDRPNGFRLPPTERRTRLDEILRLLARRPALAGPARRRWRRHARRQWTSPSIYETPDLSGAFLAFRRSAWQELPLDDGFPLYYEETDWLLRLRAAGQRVVHVPTAEALHAYAQSTRAEPRVAEWFRVSENRFRRRHYGRAFTELLARAGSLWAPGGGSTGGAGVPTAVIEGPGPLPFETPGGGGGARPFWIELSPSPLGFPAAGMRVQSPEEATITEVLWGALAPGCYYLRASDSSDRTVGFWILRVSP